MVDRIGSGNGALAREAIRAAIDAQSKAAERIGSPSSDGAGGPGGIGGVGGVGGVGAPSTNFAEKLAEGIRSVNEEVAKAEQLPQDFVSGKVDDFHEVAVQLKRADISFRFALEIRNKLIDAYREVMRMNV